MMTNTLKIRRAGIDDLTLLLQMRMEALYDDRTLASGDSSEIEEASWQYYSNALANGTHIACIAESDSTVIGCGGMCLHNEIPSALNPSGRCACLMNIRVSSGTEGYDTGRAIVGWLVAEARRLGISKIYLETSVAERYMYHSLGFRGMDDMMILSAAAV